MKQTTQCNTCGGGSGQEKACNCAVMKQRDKFLTEAMGYEIYLGLDMYINPKMPYFEFNVPKTGINFACWDGFGKLWEWSQKQEWWDNFHLQLQLTNLDEPMDWYVNPDRFADAVYEFLKEK